MPDARLARLVEAVQAIAGDLGLDAVLQRIVEAALDLVDARYAALGVIDHGRDRSGDDARPFLSSFLHAGMPDAVVAAIPHLPHGDGILGLLIQHPQPIRLEDLATHPASVGFPPGHPPMGTFLGAPIRVHGQVYGNLYLTEKAGGVPFEAGDQELVEALAAVAGSAIANAQLFGEVQRLSLIEDRERIGRDLHDTVIQRLFATGLTLQALARRCEVEYPEGSGRVLEAVDDLDETIREIRGVIFSLQDAGTSTGLRARTMALCQELAGPLGRAPRIRFDGPVDLVTSPSIAEQAGKVLREALTNVARHAQATEVVVEVVATPERLEVIVTDNGVGLPPRRREGALGLANLERRAADLGGSFSVGSNDKGTTLQWVVPV